jgi:predicted DNA-binding protein (MmcQ/YjbR family)
MDIDILRQYCISKKNVTEEFPFDEETLVFKVSGKIFMLMNIKPPISISLKCEPEKAMELRERYDSIKPGYHMNKKHWNTIEIDGSISIKILYEMIDESYILVISKIPKKRSKNN